MAELFDFPISATKSMRTSYRCPSCGYPRSWVVRRSHRTCKRCRTEWSPGNTRPVPGFHTDKKSWQKIIATFLAERTIDAVSKECGLSKNTAWRHVRAIRLVMTEDVPVSFSGTCEADATFVGGAFSNKHIHIRKQGSKKGSGNPKTDHIRRTLPGYEYGPGHARVKGRTEGRHPDHQGPGYERKHGIHGWTGRVSDPSEIRIPSCVGRSHGGRICSRRSPHPDTRRILGTTEKPTRDAGRDTESISSFFHRRTRVAIQLPTPFT